MRPRHLVALTALAALLVTLAAPPRSLEAARGVFALDRVTLFNPIRACPTGLTLELGDERTTSPNPITVEIDRPGRPEFTPLARVQAALDPLPEVRVVENNEGDRYDLRWLGRLEVPLADVEPALRPGDRVRLHKPNTNLYGWLTLEDCAGPPTPRFYESYEAFEYRTPAIVVAERFRVEDVKVELWLEAAQLSRTRVTLTAPDGRRATLLNRPPLDTFGLGLTPGYGRTGASAWFDDDSSYTITDLEPRYDWHAIRPAGPRRLSALRGAPSAGTWTLSAIDVPTGREVSGFYFWRLYLERSERAYAPLIAR